MLELDLIGRTVRLNEQDVRWLYARAKADGGSSLGSRDLATRLQGLDSTQSRNRLVLLRSEAKALERLLNSSEQPPEGVAELRLSLTELLAPG